MLTVLRYIERNPLRANLVGRAEEWPWSSLRLRLQPDLVPCLDPGPVPLGVGWLEYVNSPQTEEELARLRASVNRGRLYGSQPWVAAAAARLGLESTLRPTGRPRQQALKEPGQDLLF